MSAGPAWPLATVRGELGEVPWTPGTGHAAGQNWQSSNALDVNVPVGTPVLAVADGVISDSLGFGDTGKGGRFAGMRLHLVADDGETWFYTHLSSICVEPGERVARGQQLGESGSALGVGHLHLACEHGDPLRVLAERPES
jgi:murein DD-endopeptidase MepM/ murein hydrolase activator NlpD